MNRTGEADGFPFSEQELRAAAQAVRVSMLSSLPEPSECRPVFSDRFLREMDALCRRERRREKSRTFLQRAAIILLAVFTGLTVWLAADADARASLIRWIREVHHSWTEYRFSPRENTGVLPDFSLSRLPEGYSLPSADTGSGVCVQDGNKTRDEDSTQNQDGRTILYENPDTGERLTFGLWFYDSSNLPAVFSDYDREHHITIHRVSDHMDLVGFFYPEYGDNLENVLVWTDYVRSGTDMGRELGFCLTGRLSEGDLLELAGGVVPSQELPIYELTWLPEGYAETPAITWRPLHISYYENPENGDRFSFRYRLMDNDFSIQVPGTNHWDVATVWGHPADFYNDTMPDTLADLWGNPADMPTDSPDTPTNTLIWMDNDRLVFVLEGKLNRDTMLQIAENIRQNHQSLPVYRIGWLPEGYQKNAYRLEETAAPRYDCAYTDGGGGSIHFLYYHAAADRPVLFSPSGWADITPDELRTNIRTARLFQSEDGRQRLLAWVDETESMVFHLYSTEDKDVILHIADSVFLAKTTK